MHTHINGRNICWNVL